MAFFFCFLFFFGGLFNLFVPSPNSSYWSSFIRRRKQCTEAKTHPMKFFLPNRNYSRRPIRGDTVPFFSFTFYKSAGFTVSSDQGVVHFQMRIAQIGIFLIIIICPFPYWATKTEIKKSPSLCCIIILTNYYQIKSLWWATRLATWFFGLFVASFFNFWVFLHGPFSDSGILKNKNKNKFPNYLPTLLFSFRPWCLCLSDSLCLPIKYFFQASNKVVVLYIRCNIWNPPFFLPRAVVISICTYSTSKKTISLIHAMYIAAFDVRHIYYDSTYI